MTFHNGNTYNLNDPDLSYFITNTHIDKQLQNIGTITNFLNDMKYDLNYGDKKLDRYNIIKSLFQLQLEKVGGNDNPMLSEQIVAIADKLLEYESITTNQHQNIVSAFTKKDQFVD